MPDPIAALEARVRAGGGEPLLTHYDSQSRIELSAKTFANWVDKTVHLIDNIGTQLGSPLWLQVLGSRPDHWAALVWALAAWQFGSSITLVQTPDVELAVVPPSCPQPVPGLETVACSLHPLGLGFTTPITAIDYHEALAMSDVHFRNPAPNQWWLGAELTFAASPARVALGEPHTPERNLSALVGALLGGGSLVLVRDHELEATAARERASLG